MIPLKIIIGLLSLILLNTQSYAQGSDPNQRAEQLFEHVFEQWVALSPMWQTQLGRNTNKDQWDDISPQAQAKTHELYQRQLEEVRALPDAELTQANRLNKTLLMSQLQNAIDDYVWRDHNYPVNQMFGLHSGIPAFLMNSHTIHSEADVQSYIARLEGVAPLIDQLIDNLNRRAEQGIIAPSFVYPLVIQDCQNLLTGAPFQANINAIQTADASANNSPLWQDFTRRLSALNLPKEDQQAYLNSGKQAMLSSVQPAYQKLIAALEKLNKISDSRAGAWKLPAGERFYQHQLESMTTTQLTAQQIHQTGLAAVKRIHHEMGRLQERIGFAGDLNDFFTYINNNQDQYYPDTEAGKAAYLEDTQIIIDEIRSKLPELFNHIPKAELIVKAVEPFREKSAGKAFYQSPAEDGSRPGIYYVNLHDMSAMPKYQMRALAYHEALPGHHMQIATAQELQGLPAFRRHGHYTAYIEGWGLYAEQVAAELGLYPDPYSEFGRLSFELWRAIRLVVDTGIHHYRWSKQDAIDYFVKNSPMSLADATREVERYIVMPGQATTYMIGMLEIQRLKSDAQRTLGLDFSSQDFHDQLLRNGALPLNILKRKIQDWSNSKRKR